MPSIREMTAVVREIADVVKQHVSAAFGPLAERVKALEARQAMKGEQGEPGKDGAPGKDAEPVLVADVVRELIACPDLRPVLDLLATEAVAKHFEANPVQPGRDGKDVTPEQITRAVAEHLTANPPAPGKDGRDGLDVKDLFRAEGGRLMATLSDGTTRDLGVFIGKDGAPGKDGLDGFSLDDLTIEDDGDGTITLKFTRGELVRQKEIRYPRGDRGVYKADENYRKGDGATFGGSWWIAQKDAPQGSPGLSPDWRLAVKKGRDGKDGRNGIDKTAPVKLEAGK